MVQVIISYPDIPGILSEYYNRNLEKRKKTLARISFLTDRFLLMLLFIVGIPIGLAGIFWVLLELYLGMTGPW